VDYNDACQRVYSALIDMHTNQVGTEGVSLRVNPQDWADLKTQAQELTGGLTVEPNSFFGILVEPNHWVPLGKIFVCREA
jgi:hypothetical protein